MAKNNNAARLGEDFTPEESSALEADRSNTAPVEQAQAPVVQQAPVVTAPEGNLAPVEGEHQEGELGADGQPQQRRMVDYGAMKEEREKRKASEKREREASEKLATLAGRFQILEQLASQAPRQQGQQQQALAEVVIPDIATDPVGHFQAQLAREQTQRQALEQRLQQNEQWRQSQEQNAQAMNNVQQLTRIALAHESEFSKAQPEYQKAAAYVRDMRDAELAAMGYQDPAQRAQMIQNDALNIAAQALSANMNAAEVVWAIAQARGYKPAAAASVAPKPQSVVPAANDATNKLKTVAKGQETGQSLGQVNGAPPAQETLPERLLAMSDKDFEEATKGDKWRTLFA
jgi:hypothetical protein